MNLDNLTRDQKRYIYNEISRAIHNTQERLFNHGIDFDLLQMLKAFISFFIDQPEIREEGVLRTVLSMILPQKNQDNYIDGIVNTVKGINLAGKILFHQGGDEANKQVLMDFKTLNHIYNQEQKKIKSLTEKLFFYGFHEIQLENAQNRMQHQHIKNKKFFTFQKEIKEHQQWRHCSQMVREWKFDKEFVLKKFTELSGFNSSTSKQHAIVSLYRQQMDYSYSSFYKYNCHLLIQYLLSINNKRFVEEFEILNGKDFDMFISCVAKRDVDTLLKLKMRTNIAKHLECSEIRIQFSDNFKLEDIPDNVIINMLDNSQNRLYRFSGSDSFVIIRRLSDNKVMKCTITDDNQQEIENMLQQCNDRNVYDVIIVSEHKYENLRDVRMRYLNYVCFNNIEITLNHPEDLVSLSTVRAKISNINKCTNLKNLYSENNTYTKDDINQLMNLRKIYNRFDQYEHTENCLLEDLFQNNKLEYINIDGGQNIQIHTLLKQNIQNLRFINTDEINIKLDINSYSDHINSLYDIFLKKYVDQKEEYQDIDFYDRQWVIQQITSDQYIKYKQLTFNHDPFDPLNYKSRFINIFLQQDTIQEQEEMLSQLIQDIKQYKAITQVKPGQLFDIIDVNNLVQLKKYVIFVNNSNNVDYKTKYIKRLYNAFAWDIQTNFSMLQMIQQLIAIDVKTFKKDFYVDSEDTIKSLVDCLIKDLVQNIRQLHQILSICKYLDCKRIDLDFNEKFNLKDIQNNILVHLFDKISDRMQVVEGSQSFVIIHRICDDKIWKLSIANSDDSDSTKGDNEKDKQKVEQIFLQCNDNQVYDIVICSNKQYKNLQNIRIRYLNYVSWDPIVIILNHPEDLISLALQGVVIKNLNQCANLQNLCSIQNIYNLGNISELRNLRRIYSFDDKYQNRENCFLKDLFENNKLEYVDISNQYTSSNIVAQAVLSRNISNLRYIDIYQSSANYTITLDVTNELPENMSVYHIDLDDYYGDLKGSKENVKRLESNLIHELKQNK